MISFAYITVVLVSQRDSKECLLGQKNVFQSDVALLICGKASQQGYGVSCFTYVRSGRLITWHSLMVLLNCNLYEPSDVSV